MEQNSVPHIVRVLLVDDDEEDYLIIKHLFQSMKSIASELEWVASSEEAIAKIKDAQHDAYLIDYRLDARTGLDVLEEVHAAERSEPFILLTGVGDEGIERRSLKLSASDYLVKRGLTSENLARTLYYALGRKAQEKQKIEQLLELNHAKDEFISIASHQLRTPVTTVKQYTAMLLDGLAGEMSEQQRQFLTKVYDSNERQLAIINALLKVAQIDAGGMELALQPTDVGRLVNEAVDDFRPSFQQAQQRVTSQASAGAETRFEVHEKVATVEIVIADHGVGVERPERLFQKFSRISNKLSNEVGGTGLGLYWAQSIARLHGGDLRYDPNHPVGSKFTLILPYV
jgi:signal transduction histidine kinase